MVPERLGRWTGYCKGQGEAMRVADSSIGMLGCNGIVGGGVSIASAQASAFRQVRGTDQVTVVFFGDGAAQDVWPDLGVDRRHRLLQLPVVNLVLTVDHRASTVLRLRPSSTIWQGRWRTRTEIRRWHERSGLKRRIS